MTGVIPVIVSKTRGNGTGSLPVVLPSLFENCAAQAEQVEFLDGPTLTAMSYIKCLSFVKLLRFIEEDVVFPVWRSGVDRKKHPSNVKKLVNILTTRGLRQHKLVAQNFLSANYLGSNHEWSRCAFSLMLDFGLIRLYRQRISHDGVQFPLAVNVLKELYFRRFAQLDLNEKAWCDEASALDKSGRIIALKEFRRLLANLEKALSAQAKEDAELLINFVDKPMGLVKRLAIENAFFQCYRELFVGAGITAPRFSWQLKSTLSKAAGEKLLADFA